MLRLGRESPFLFGFGCKSLHKRQQREQATLKHRPGAPGDSHLPSLNCPKREHRSLGEVVQFRGLLVSRDAVFERELCHRPSDGVIEAPVQRVKVVGADGRSQLHGEVGNGLPAVAITALRSHRTHQLEARLAAGRHWQDRDFVLTSAVGTPLEPRNVTRQFKALLTAANLPDMRLHDLRHSCATLLLAQGVNPRVVMETLGHSQVSLTLNTYSHVLPALQRDAAARMDSIFAK